jgi:hypothetical protein
VQVIGDFARNHKLGLVLEIRAGKVNFLVCRIDVLGLPDKPKARQPAGLCGHEGFRPRVRVGHRLLTRQDTTKGIIT